MRNKPANAILSVAFALTLATLACNGGAASPTTAPTPAVAATQAAVTDTPENSAPTEAATAAATDAATTAATEAATEAATSAPTEAPTAAALSGSLDLHGISGYSDTLQYYYVSGLLTNGTDKPVDDVELSLELVDGSGKSVLQDNSGNPTTTVSFQPILSTIDSGGSTPFSYFMSADGLDTSGWKATVKVVSNDNPTDLERTQVVVDNPVMTTASDGDIYLTGEVVNKSDQPGTINNFAAALLDGDGNVAAASSFQDITRLLSATGDPAGNDRSPFVVKIPGPIAAGTQPSFYVDAVQGDTDDIQAASDIHLELNTLYSDQYDDVYVVATVTNSGTNTMTVRVMAGLYDKDSKVLDGSSGRALLDLAPGASSPVTLYYFDNVNGNTALLDQVVSYTAQIDPYWTYIIDGNFVDLEASNVTTEIDGSSLSVKGDVANNSDKTLLDATVVLIVHDADGNVVASDWALASPDSGDFSPNTTQPWQTTIQLPTKLDPATLTVETQVQGEIKSE